MDKTNPLDQLKDIHLPDPIGWWPLAPGWYALLLLLLVLMGIFALRIYKRYKHALAKKKALILLSFYQQDYAKESNISQSSAHISELLRRVALVYYPREQVASLQGEAWLQFLNATSKGVDFNSIRHMLLDAPFKHHPTMDLTPLFDQARLWIKQRGAPCSN